MPSSEIKAEIVKYYKSFPMSLTSLQKHFNYCKPVLSKIIKEAGVPIWSTSLIFNPNLKEDFFEQVGTEKKAYFLGLIMADGCVFHPQKQGQASISITLKQSDDYILQQFKVEVGASTEVVRDTRGTSTIAIRSNKMANDLARLGAVSGKENRTTLPALPSELYSHWFRGFFDGDGCVMSNMAQSGKHRHGFAICGVPLLINKIQDYFVCHLGVAPRKPYYYTETFGEIKWNRIEDIVKIGSFLYSDATICLSRKRDVYRDFLAHYNIPDSTKITP